MQRAQAVKKPTSFAKSETVEQATANSRPEDRRAQPRFTTQFRSTFSGQRDEGQGRTLDISVGGCKIESTTPVAEGTKFELRLHIPGLDWPLRVDEATVRWVNGNTFGLRFTRMSPEEVDKLKTAISSLEQDE